MERNINPNLITRLEKGTVIYNENDPVHKIALILKGSVVVHNVGARFTLHSGTFVGLNDMISGKFLSTYEALEDLVLYIFPISRVGDFNTFIRANSEYNAHMVSSLNKIIYEMRYIYDSLVNYRTEIYEFIKETYNIYMHYAVVPENGLKLSTRLNELIDAGNDFELLDERINYYSECSNIPLDVIKSICSYGLAISEYQIIDQSDALNQLIDTNKDIVKDIEKIAEYIAGDDESLSHIIAKMGSSKINNGIGIEELMDIMDSMVEKINRIEKFSTNKLGSKLLVNKKSMEEAYHLLLTSGGDKEGLKDEVKKKRSLDSDKVKKELNNSFKKIIEFANINQKKAKDMEEAMYAFINLKDKLSSRDEDRKVRKKLTSEWYELYKEVFLKAYDIKEVPRIIDLFLKYGYADERLLSKEQLLSLYYLEEETNKDQNLIYPVYNIKEWLTLIYEGKKEPSKNEFDMEYSEMLNSLKKRGKLSVDEANKLSDDCVKKLEYEIDNMLKYNNRTTNGQISTFVPVLHSDIAPISFEKSYISIKRVNEAINDLLAVDYSIFCREVIYSNIKVNIVRQMVVKKVYPDIVLMPTVGINGVMWQEMTGRKRDSAGRFLLPSFTDYNLLSILVKVFGRFRWEMCRSIEGLAWNDIKNKSLTSEYTDYLQFYKKSKDLSEEKKEKIKQQIKRGRNNSREIFTIDYEQWITYESKGAIKLNKIVRELLATYCPFSKEIRERYVKQPLFEEALNRFKRNKKKKTRELEARIRLFEKEKIEPVPEIIKTLDFYKNT